MKTNLHLRLIFSLCCVLLSSFILKAQTGTKVEVGHIYPGETSYAGFKLGQDATIKINGTGARYDKWGNNLVFYGWIIESESREVVWSLLDEYEDRLYDDEGSFSFDKELKLKKGSYEVYYTGMNDHSDYNIKIDDIGQLIDKVVEAITDDDYRPYYKRDNYMAVSCDSKSFSVNDGRDYVDNLMKKSIVSFVRNGNDEARNGSFSLNKETKIYIYCEGEKQGREFYDFGWIYNLKTHERVWPDNSTDYERGGGGRKNFAVFQEINLPTGEYQVNYVTDGSHSFEKWNVMPPSDPQFWGIAVWCDRKDMKNVSKDVSEHKPVVDLTRIRDNEYVSQGFEIEKPMDVRVICIGEIMGDSPDDYGWIMDAESRNVVWKFSRAKSEYAGGSNKNRMANEVINLKKGKYIAYFVTDGSHSYHDWNAAPPYDQDLWGLSLWLVDDNDKANMKKVDEDELKNENVITEITGVRNNFRDYKNFTLDKETKVRIYAIGEGDDGSMYDTGWIKNMDTGKIVWEMTYRTSEHAGGASKNRMYNDFILLPKGDYRVYYESDGSHAYMNWNDDPPYDQANYGIQILKK